MAVKYQLGKGGISDNFVNSLRLGFKNNVQVRIYVLRSFSRDREEIKNTAEELCKKLEGEKGYKNKIIGFTIILNQVRKSKLKK